MRNTLCIRRVVDNLGRVTIPIDMRRALNIEVGDAVYVGFDGKVISVFKQNISDLAASISCVLENASDSYNLTNTDFEVLTELLNKLGGKDE